MYSITAYALCTFYLYELFLTKLITPFDTFFQVAQRGETDVFPNSVWLPSSGVRVGTVMRGVGDPLTPGWPSLPGAHRVSPDDIDTVPKIPVHTIGYGDARELLSKLGGQNAPRPWVGRLSGVEYKLGGEFLASSGVNRVRLTTTNVLVKSPVSNVMGIIKGTVEPYRYVFLRSR